MKYIRSFLFAPGSNENIIKKALNASADTVIIDLEDATAVNEKDRARDIALKISLTDRDKPLYIRINDAKSPFFKKDLELLGCARLDGVVLPKCEDPEDIVKLTQTIKGNMDVIPLIESAKGIINLINIGSASKKISRFAFGAIDYTLDINAQYTKSGLELLYPRSYLVLISRVLNLLSPVDTVFPDLNDEAGLINETKHVKELGFFGKLAINPRQVNIINEIFTPTEFEIDEAKKIAQAFLEAEKEGIASIRVDNKFVDYPVYMKSKRIIELANILEKKK